METCSFVLADIHDLSSLFIPLKTTQRIKYTCFNVSQNLLVLGASSGGLYVFRREPCSFIQLLPSQEGSVTHVAISPDEKLFAFASVKGIVCVLEKNSSGLGARRIFTSSEHIGVSVTALQWSGQSNELFIGDQAGKVSLISLLPFMMKNMFNPPSCTLMLLDSQIVQLDWQADLLLVSTLTRSYICDVSKERFRQIGMKLRDGEYGACFFVSGELPIRIQLRTEAVGGSFSLLGEGERMRDGDELENIKAFCARPGSRLWEVHVDGTVLNTHQFKQALAIPSTSMIRLSKSCNSSQEDNKPLNSTNIEEDDVIVNKQSFNFCKLFVLAKKYLFTFKRDGIYIFDPQKASVVLWSSDISDIIDAQVLKDMIYVRTSSGNMHGILFTPLEKFLIRLYLRKQYALCAELCEIHSKYLMKEAPTSSKLHLLADLGTKLSNDDVAERILPLLQQISKCAQESKNAQRLESGIFVVENRHFLSKGESEASIPDLPQLRRSERFKDKPRSLSVSPERTRRRKKADALKGTTSAQRSGSASSLPELVKTGEKCDSKSEDSPSCDSQNDIRNCESESYPHTGMKKSFSRELFTSFDTSPEAIQALKEIGQTVSSKITNSTKTLKEKWQVFEGKILGTETTPELLDVRTPDYVETPITPSDSNALEICDDGEIVFSAKPDRANGRNKFHPELDTKNISYILQESNNWEDTSSDEFRKSVFNFLYEIIYLYSTYRSHLMDQIINENLKNPEVCDESRRDSKSTMFHFVHEFSESSFPFKDFFSEETIADLSQKFHRTLSTKILFLWLKELLPFMQNNLQRPDLLALYPLEAVQMDVLLSRLIVVCSDLLDPHTILQCIKDSGVSCYHVSFCTILDKYQAGALQQVGKENSVESSCWQWPLPLRLNAMFFMLRMNQIETCIIMGSNIDIQDICYLVLRLQQELASTNEGAEKTNSFTMFLSYLDRVADFENVMQNLLKNEHLTAFTTMAFEAVNKNEKCSCRCGFPFPAGECSQVQFYEIGRMLCNHLWQTNHDRHREMCERVPVLWKPMLANTLKENLESVLPLLVQLGDFSLLDGRLKDMVIGEWEQILDMTAAVRSGQCLKCGLVSIPRELCETVSMSMAATLMVKSLGAHAAVDLLAKHPASAQPGLLHESFFRSCIFSAIVDSRCDDLRSQAVDLACAHSELKAKKPLVSHEFGKLVEEALALDLAKVSVRAAEADSPNHHWGVRVDLKKGCCPCCDLPLGTPVLLEDGGLTVFQCGHAFHVVCLKQRPAFVCVLCTRSS